MPRLAKSLVTLRRQIDAYWPSRSKDIDGWLGDTAHKARRSDHNPNAVGVVRALDITHDPINGPVIGALAQQVIDTRDDRIKYVIANGRIAAGQNGPSPWMWRPYSGPNSHQKHVHVSVRDAAARYDDPREWDLRLPVRQSTRPSVSTVRVRHPQRVKSCED